MVSVLAFYSNDRTSLKCTIFSVLFVYEKNENKKSHKEAWVGPFLKSCEASCSDFSALIYLHLYMLNVYIHTLINIAKLT